MCLHPCARRKCGCCRLANKKGTPALCLCSSSPTLILPVFATMSLRLKPNDPLSTSRAISQETISSASAWFPAQTEAGTLACLKHLGQPVNSGETLKKHTKEAPIARAPSLVPMQCFYFCIVSGCSCWSLPTSLPYTFQESHCSWVEHLGWIYFLMSIGFLEAKKVSSRPLRLQAMGGQMIITKEIMAAVWGLESTQHQGEASY